MVLLVSLFGIIFGLLTKFSFGRNLLLKYPKFFTLGFVSHEGPTEEAMKNSKFEITFVGIGWPKEDALAEPTDQHTNLPSKKIVTRVSASNPGTNLFFSFYLFKIELSIKMCFLHILGYGATVIALLLSAKTILTEKEKLPLTGGVLPPGACFAKTDMIPNLIKNGFVFEVVEN